METCVNWINHLLKEVDETPNEKTLELIEHCGKGCAIRQDAIGGIKQLKESYKGKTRTEHVEFFKSLGIDATEEDDGILLKLGKTECTCPMAPEVNNPALCNCTLGHEKYVWGEFFGKEIDVELVETILREGDDCVIKIFI